MTIGRNRRQFIELDKENLALEEYDSAKRQRPAMDDKIDAHRSFRRCTQDTDQEEQVNIETAAVVLDGGLPWSIRTSVSAVVSARQSVNLMRSICTASCRSAAVW